MRNFGSRNPAGQITSVVEGNDALAFPYANINRTDAINGLNQITNTGGTTVSYGDQRGNITAIGSTTYTYSPENRLISTNTGVTLNYRPLGQLHQISSGSGTTRFLYDGDAMIAEYDGSNNLQRRYVFGPGVDEPLVWYEGTGTTDRRFFNADERGSIMGVNNSSSVPVGTFNRYDEYGNVAGTLNGRFGYTGQAWLPEIGMYYYKARLYNQSLGRFMQTEPVNYQNRPNLYTYAGNEPVNMADPTGKDAIMIHHRDGSRTLLIPVRISGSAASPDVQAAIVARANAIQTADPSLRIQVVPTSERIHGVLNRLDYSPGYDRRLCPNAGECTDELGGDRAHINSDNPNSIDATAHEILHFAGIDDAYDEGKRDSSGQRTYTHKPGYTSANIMADRRGNQITRDQFDEADRNSSTRDRCEAETGTRIARC